MSNGDDDGMTTTLATASWTQFFTAELDRLRGFYSIEFNEEDIREMEGWLKDRLEVRSGTLIAEKLRSMSEREVRQIRYEFVQSAKRNRRFRKSQANTKLQPVGAANPMGESEERDRRIE
jgi:hypothetical protein